MLYMGDFVLVFSIKIIIYGISKWFVCVRVWRVL